ncbi:DUF1761 domain-containing protein [Subsaximicrobium wynnwilliamsii]|uniref:DUF1761 domain-containing protein n=1 Tax=Subsaximicrobium wynnwilliamsii TaxID=291179 RepID=A0A5C6ZEH6_9FLAO|nr:DUF1761 domain-containing protein [Subsaximicrobium wynnwilliamsii]TXD82630.1 DUF1761 domain-containing protein [Subsaximicrobium wynnwilliamsii]TXD88365.1 DUF1761 domain-containing protein [Subsaximicrobium wynnwilliamsii]TXE02292.1 DUF1761 domain-containing protein [Subsaximicrobium wynnwilliamsii]
MEFNYLAILAASAVPIVISLLWYHPKTLGILWMRESGMTEEKFRSSNVAVIYGVSLLLAIVLAFSVQLLVIHQMGVYSLMGGNPEAALPSYQAFMDDYGTAFRTFKHGALHGFLSALFLFFPVIAINALFERRSWKYIFINTGFWTLSLTIMGAIICGWN